MWRRSLFVGYAQSGLQSGASMLTPQFQNIGASEAMPLESLTPTGDGTSDAVYIQTLDAYGRTVDSYYWNDWMYESACWVDGEYNAVSGVSFEPGQGLWVYGANGTQGLQSAGKVGKSDVAVQLQNGATGTGNPFPTSVALTDILPLGDGTSDTVYIQTLDAYGRTVDSYYWNDWMYENPCWVDGEYNAVTDVNFVAGQGLWIYGANSEQSIQFPAPEL